MNGAFKIHPITKRALRAATAIVAGMPEELPSGFDPTVLRCHEVARVAQRLMGHVGEWEVVDGHYGPYEHSWLASRKMKMILDVYTIGRHPVVQVVDPYLIYGAKYREGAEREDIRWEVIEHLLYGGYPKPGLESGFWRVVPRGHPYYVRERAT